MKKLFENSSCIIMFLIVIAICCYPIIFVYLIIIVIAWLYIKGKVYMHKLEKFKKENNGKVYYIYSSKKRWKQINLKFVLPILENGIGKIYNYKGNIETVLPLNIFLSYYLQIDNLKYPLFMKIVEDKAVGVSIYNDLVELHNNTIDVIQFQNQVKQKLSELEKKSQ